MGGARDTHGLEEKFIQGFGEEKLMKENAWKT
jgi:hypothetical protein